jgi:hypothetical protein
MTQTGQVCEGGRGMGACFRKVVTDPSPERAIAELGDAELEALGAEVLGLPDSGFPGVVAALVRGEKARRWDTARAAERIQTR